MLSIRNLVKVYPGPVTALQGVSLEVPPGMFGLLGPNGARKSTLMRVLAGLLKATSGSVLLDGTDLLRHPDQIWPHLGFLPQDLGFYPHLTGAAMLDFLLQRRSAYEPHFGYRHRRAPETVAADYSERRAPSFRYQARTDSHAAPPAVLDLDRADRPDELGQFVSAQAAPFAPIFGILRRKRFHIFFFGS